MLAGHVDLDELDRSVRIGWERQQGVSVPCPEGPPSPTVASASRSGEHIEERIDHAVVAH